MLLAGFTTPFASSESAINPGCFLQVDVDVALVVDTSGSMNDQGKLPAALSAGSAFLAQLQPNDQSALVTFNTSVTLVKGLSNLHTGPAPSTDYYLSQQTATGLTALWMGIRMAHYELINQPHANPAPYSGLSRYPNAGGHSKQAIVLLSDGEQTVGPNDPITEAAAAKAHGIEVFTIALGTAFAGNSLSVLENVSTDKAHAFVSPTNAQLKPLFLRISGLIRDIAAPTVDIARPTNVPASLYVNDIAVAAAPFAAPYNIPTVKNTLTPYALANDDCVVDHVDFFVDQRNDAGMFAGTVPLGTAFTATTLVLDNGSIVTGYAAGTYRCDGLVGPHTIRAIATDWLGKVKTTTATFQCIVERITADASVAYARATDPVDPTVTAQGAHLGGGLGVRTTWVQNASITTPLVAEVASGYDRVNGTLLGGDMARVADARSRVERVMLDALGLDFTVIETTACAKLNSDWSRPLPARFVATTCSGNATWRADSDPTGLLGFIVPTVLPGGCFTTVESGATVQRCWEQGFVGPSIQVLLNERVVVTGPAASEVTMNGVDIIIERPEGRAELVLAQSYAGASYLGSRLLQGPWLALDRERDAGVPGDAPDSPAAAWPLSPGVYAARLARASDADAYSTKVALGEKVHALVVPSNKESVSVGTLPNVVPNGPGTRGVTVELYDPDLVLRDAKTSLLLGLPTQVELNVDKAGTWVVVVRLPNSSLPTDYAFTLTVTPVALTHADDALSLQDAGADCLHGLFVGPGVHVGTLEDKTADASDWYRFQLFEGETATLLLRPGDTLDSTSMRLRVFDPQCQELPVVTKMALVGGLKGGPSQASYTAPVGGGGIYRAAIEYDNGIGTYELALATGQTGVLWRLP